MGESDLDHLTSVFQLIKLKAGDVLCREGNRVENLYLVKRGNCRLLKAFLPLEEDEKNEKNEELDTQKDDDVANKEDEKQHRAGSPVASIAQVSPRLSSQGSSSFPSSIASTFKDAHYADGKVPHLESGATKMPSCHRALQGEDHRQLAPVRSAQESSSQKETKRGKPPSALHVPRYFDVGCLQKGGFAGSDAFVAAACARAGGLGMRAQMAPRVGSRKRGDETLESRIRNSGGCNRGTHEGTTTTNNNNSHRPDHDRIRYQASPFPVEVNPARKFIITAITEMGADVYAAKVCDLVNMQTVAMKRCWAEGQNFHCTREWHWRAETLGARVREQLVWDENKRSIVLDQFK